MSTVASRGLTDSPLVRTRSEAALASVVGLLLAGVLKWPVLSHLRSSVPEDLGDPLLQTWQLSWGAHALLHDPLHVWDSNTFFPLDRTLAFSDSLLGYAPLGVLFGDSALVRYNTVFLLAYALAFTGAYALARQLGTSRLAAGLAGVGFAYAPWHLAQEGHLQILSDGGIPLALALLARGHGYPRGKPRPRLVLAGWAVAAWQVTLGFGLGLQFGYLLGVLALVFGIGWIHRRSPRPSRRFWLAEGAGAALFLVVAATFALPYLHVAQDHPESKRTVADLELFSPPLKGFVTTPADSWLWGDAQEEQRSSLPFAPEMTLAPGGALVALAVLGTVAGGWPRRRRLALAGGAVVLLLLALGTRLAGGRYSYLLLFEHAPGWEGIRTPGRLVVPLTLALGLLAANGVDRLRAWARGGHLAVAGVALALVAAEVVGTTPTPAAPPLPAALDHADGPVLVLPTDGFHDNWAMYWSSAGLYEIANGNSGFVPRELDQLRTAAASFPDAASVSALQGSGIRRVVLIPAYAGGSPWQGAESKPVDGLPLVRRQVGEAFVYELAPTG
ncbi:MAG: hypothetical protein JWN77_749 [Frankiales bacterium]|nr:hypothetical protein [Frankiales bacterium]